MREAILLLAPILIPILSGLVVLFMPQPQNRKPILWITGSGLVVAGGFVVAAVLGNQPELLIGQLTEGLPIYFKLDTMGSFFVSIATIVWILAGVFSFSYMKYEKEEKRYFGFYLITYGVIVAVNFAGNLITLYLFYEMMSLCATVLVIHTRKHEAIMAGLKYIFYSLCGAYMALWGIFFIGKYASSLTFTPGGVLSEAVMTEHGTLLLVVAFMMILGFGVKASMFPFHIWLPTAHAVDPAPVSATLSAIITKGGILATIRVVYYIFGANNLSGTWVQTIWITLSLITILMGSTLAYRAKNLKKRLAYCTVSQLSYIVFGLSLLQETAFVGSMLHVAAHAFIKCTLFLTAGVIIVVTGKTRTDELRGIGKAIPGTLWCFAFVSLGMIGIPPTGGFFSKWYLAIGSLESGIPILSWLGPVVLLMSALLTAGYLLPIVTEGFLPGEDVPEEFIQKKTVSKCMIYPLIILTILSILVGIFSNQLVQGFAPLVSQFF